MTLHLAPHYLVNADGLCFYPVPVDTWAGSPDTVNVTAKAADGWIDTVRTEGDGGPTNRPYGIVARPCSRFRSRRSRRPRNTG